MSANKVKYGLSNCVMAPFTLNGTTYTYSTPIAVPGAVNLTLSAEGDTNDFYADNLVYFSSTANQGYSGDLEIAMIPDEIRTAILNEVVDANGAYIEDASKLTNGFAFGFQIEGDKKNRRFWYYNCSLTRPANNGATTESSITPQTDTLTIKAMPRLSDKKVRAMLELTDDNTAVYNSFFSQVYEAEVSE